MNFAYYLHDEKSQQEFERTLLWFKDKYNLVSINELRALVYENKPLKNACMLSVDDGWRSTYDVIYPVMKKYNVPFTVFVSPETMESGRNFWYYTLHYCDEVEVKDILVRRGWFQRGVRSYPIELILKEIPIGEIEDVLVECLHNHPEVTVPRGFMNTEEVMELHRSGLVEVGAHTLTHPILSVEDAERSHMEITASVERLSDILGKRVTSFAYPNGIERVDYDEREMQFAKDADIEMAFSVDPGLITAKCNPLSIPRWGSMARLRFGRFGQYLPSRMNQAKIRADIRKYKLR